MNNPEPPVVTIAKMNDHLEVRVSEAEQALAEACAEVAREAQTVESGGDAAALRRLASAEKRRDKAAAELERLRLSSSELAGQLTEQREADEAGGQRALVAAYIDHHEKVQKATRAMFEAIEAMKTQTDEAHQHSRLAGRLANRLGFPNDERGGAPLGRQLGYLKSAMDGVLSGQPRLVNSARGVVMADWRETPNGRRALALQAALDPATMARPKQVEGERDQA